MRTLEDVMRDLGFDLKLSKKGVSVDLSTFLNLKSLELGMVSILS